MPPQQGIGRIAKVGREEIVGLVVALRAYLRRDHEADQVRWLGVARAVRDALADATGGDASILEPPASAIPVVLLSFASDRGPDAAPPRPSCRSCTSAIWSAARSSWHGHILKNALDHFSRRQAFDLKTGNWPNLHRQGQDPA